MKLHRRGKWLGAVIAAAGMSLMVVLLPSAAASVGTIATGGTFYAAQPWGTLPDNFNPYAPSGANAPGTESCIYQSLYYFNAATGAETPLLGTSYAWTDHNLKLVVTTRSGVKWSDGTSFTAADVAFTFNYLKANPSIDINGIWTSPLKTVVATGAHTVVFTFSKPDTPEAVTLLYGTDGTPTSCPSTSGRASRALRPTRTPARSARARSRSPPSRVVRSSTPRTRATGRAGVRTSTRSCSTQSIRTRPVSSSWKMARSICPTTI
jgi:ABC-type transport system substrate-binding protein